MNHEMPAAPRPLHHLVHAPRRLMTSRQLREHGVPAHRTGERCRPGGPWQQLLPGVHLLHPGPPTPQDLLQATLLYATQRPVPRPGAEEAERPAMLTGLAALALHGFASVPALSALSQVDVLVPATRRLRSAGFAHVVRDAVLPRAERVAGLPVAPVARALADAVAELTRPVAEPSGRTPAATVPGRRREAAGPASGPARAAHVPAPSSPSALAGPPAATASPRGVSEVCELLTEAVRDGHCEATAVAAELTRSGLLGRPAVAAAVETLTAEGRARAEDRLYALVRAHGLPEPVWNVDLRLPGGPWLGAVDAYWPEQAVAVEIDARGPRRDEEEAELAWNGQARKRETLERLGVTVVHLTPRKLREAPDQQAAVVRTALVSAADREPSAYLVVLPR
ncbi:hypothetical protein ACFV3R_03410 [Streptomyces sp. NPDC059740]|uniref:hypothetical protein n=1 Tax=Streptomyces sp. NPDC059740 TaxID=3346926 RepID=UPI00364662C3